jgi:hypothetical protein
MRKRDRDISFFDYPPTFAADEFDAVTERRPSRVRVICIALTVTAALGLLALPALATPWTDENGNPNPDCTGSCHETGIPNPPDPTPEPRQSHEGEPTGVSKAAAKRACEAAVTETQRESCHWPNGVYPGDKE